MTRSLRLLPHTSYALRYPSGMYRHLALDGIGHVITRLSEKVGMVLGGFTLLAGQVRPWVPRYEKHRLVRFLSPWIRGGAMIGNRYVGRWQRPMSFWFRVRFDIPPKNFNWARLALFGWFFVVQARIFQLWEALFS